MRHTTRFFAGVSAAALAAGMMATVASSAHAAPPPNLFCSGAISIVHSLPGLTDQTQIGVRATGQLGRDYSQPGFPRIGGTCINGYVRPGDTHVPQPPATLHPISESLSLLGNVSCAGGATAQSVDAVEPLGYRLNGKASWVFSEHYQDLINPILNPNYKMQAYLQIVGDTPGGSIDELDVSGIVISGVAVGSIVSGTIWHNPVVHSLSPSLGAYNTKYDFDLVSAAGCTDGNPNNAGPVSYFMIGGGDPSKPSPGLGTVAQGLTFTYPLPY